MTGPPVSPNAGKRCRYHGGATPKGKDWHRRQFPKKGAPISKLQKKLCELKARDRKAEERLANMTPEELEQYEARSKVVRPGTPAERQSARDSRNAQKLIADLHNKEKPASDEISDLGAQIQTLEDQAKQLRLDSTDTDNLPEVFK